MSILIDRIFEEIFIISAFIFPPFFINHVNSPLCDKLKNKLRDEDIRTEMEIFQILL